jgi:DNA repair protein RecO (recombination protein O)
MTESSTGLILRVRPLTETSLIVHWLTPDLGRLATVAKGARRPKSPFRGKLDLFHTADFSFQRSRRSDLHTLREVDLRETHAALRRELGYLQQASYGAALIEQTTETETPLPGVFELMTGFLRQLSPRAPRPLSVFAFEMKLLHELGQSPDLEESKLTPGARKILAELTAKDWPALDCLKLSEPQTREIQQFLHGFLIWHLGRIPAGRHAALAGD